MSKPNVILFEGFTVQSSLLKWSFDHIIPAHHSSAKTWHTLSEKLNHPFIIIAVSLGIDLAIKANAHTHPKCLKVIAIGARPHYPAHELRLVKKALITNMSLFIHQFHSRCFLKKISPSWLVKLSLMIDSYTLNSVLNELELVAQVSLDKATLDHPKLCWIHGENDAIAPLNDMQKKQPKNGITIIQSAHHLDPLVSILNWPKLEELIIDQ